MLGLISFGLAMAVAAPCGHLSSYFLPPPPSLPPLPPRPRDYPYRLPQSVTFDPFSQLSLPLPVAGERAIDLHFYPLPDAASGKVVTPIFFRAIVPKSGGIHTIKDKAAEFFGVDAKLMQAREVYGNRFYYQSHLSDFDPVSEILESDKIVLYQVPRDESREDEQKRAAKCPPSPPPTSLIMCSVCYTTAKTAEMSVHKGCTAMYTTDICLACMPACVKSANKEKTSPPPADPARETAEGEEGLQTQPSSEQEADSSDIESGLGAIKEENEGPFSCTDLRTCAVALTKASTRIRCPGCNYTTQAEEWTFPDKIKDLMPDRFSDQEQQPNKIFEAWAHIPVIHRRTVVSAMSRHTSNEVFGFPFQLTLPVHEMTGKNVYAAVTEHLRGRGLLRGDTG